MAGLKRNSTRLSCLFMVSVSVISLWQTTRKEGMRQMKRLKGGEEVCLLSDGTHTSSKRQRGGNERAWRTAEKRHKYCSIGPARESKRKKKYRNVPLWGAGNQRLNVFCLCVCSWLAGCESLQCAGWSLEGAASRCWVMGVVGDKGRRRRGGKGGRREETAHGNNKKLYRQQQNFH